MDSKAHLAHIIQQAEALREKTLPFSKDLPGQHVELTTKSDVSSLILDVPSSSHLVPELLQAGTPAKVANDISEKYHASAKQLADYQSNTSYTNAMKKLRCWPSTRDSEIITAFQNAHRQIYLKELSVWKEKILNSVKERFGRAFEPEPVRPKSFDQNFVPFLEKCFSKNQRPCRKDKELLAEKTGLSYRQVHVWFQNRRSRTKRFSETSDSRNEELSSCSRASSVTLVGNDTLSGCITPSYAFPAMYPPEIEEDPFPCRFGDFTSFCKLSWPRSLSKRQKSRSEPDVTALISIFEKLQINDDSESKTRRKKRSTSSVSNSVSKFCYEMIRPTVIRPLHAPLVALDRTEINCLSRSSGPSSQESDFAKQNESTSQNGEHSKAKSRKPRQRKAVEQSRTKDKQQSLPPTDPANEQQFVTPIVPSKTKRARRKAMRSKPATRKGCKTPAEPGLAVETVREPEEPPSSHPSPTASIESLPSLSYSTVSSSSSTYSVSPPSSFATLSDGGLMSSTFDEYRSSGLSLTLPPSLTFDDHPPPPATFTSDGFSFDLPKGPLDYPFDFGLPGYPSYTDSFDSLAQELGSSSDFMFPSSFELPCLVS